MFDLPVGLRQRDPGYKVVWTFAFYPKKVNKLLKKDEILALSTLTVLKHLENALPTPGRSLTEVSTKISLSLAGHLFLGVVRMHYYKATCRLTDVERALERMDEPIEGELEIVRRSPDNRMSPPQIEGLIDELDIRPPPLEEEQEIPEAPPFAPEEPITDFQPPAAEPPPEGEGPPPRQRRVRKRRAIVAAESSSDEEGDRPRRRRGTKKRTDGPAFIARHEDITMRDEPLMGMIEHEVAQDDLMPLDETAFAGLENAPVQLNDNTVIILHGIPGAQAPSERVGEVSQEWDFNPPPVGEIAPIGEIVSGEGQDQVLNQFPGIPGQNAAYPGVSTVPQINTDYVGVGEEEARELVNATFVPRDGNGNIVPINTLYREATSRCMTTYANVSDSGIGRTMYRASSVAPEVARRASRASPYISDIREASAPPVFLDVSIQRQGSTPIRVINVNLNYSPRQMNVEENFGVQTPRRGLSPSMPTIPEVPQMDVDQEELARPAKSPGPKGRRRNQGGIIPVDLLKNRFHRFATNRQAKGVATVEAMMNRVFAKQMSTAKDFYNILSLMKDEQLANNIHEYLKANRGRLQNRRRRSERPSARSRDLSILRSRELGEPSAVEADIPSSMQFDSILPVERPFSPMQIDEIQGVGRPPSPTRFEEHEPEFARPKTPERRHRDIEYVEPVPLPVGIEHLLSPPRPAPKDLFNQSVRKHNVVPCNVTHDDFYEFLLRCVIRENCPVFVYQEMAKEWPRSYIAVNFQNLTLLAQQRRVMLCNKENKVSFLVMPTQEYKYKMSKLLRDQRMGFVRV